MALFIVYIFRIVLQLGLSTKREVAYVLLVLIILGVLTVGVLYNYFISILSATFFILLFLVFISILIIETIIMRKATNQSCDELNDSTNTHCVERNTRVRINEFFLFFFSRPIIRNTEKYDRIVLILFAL